jgi:hypothetical protein
MPYESDRRVSCARVTQMLAEIACRYSLIVLFIDSHIREVCGGEGALGGGQSGEGLHHKLVVPRGSGVTLGELYWITIIGDRIA